MENLLDAFLSSSEEALFGDFLEKFAIFIAETTRRGRESGITGVDLEFSHNGADYLVSINSGTSWGNKSQQDEQQLDFQTAMRAMKQHNPTRNVQPVLGICYGKTRTSFPRGYMKVVGQSFWYFLSDNANLYMDIIEPLDYYMKDYTDAFLVERAHILNMFTQQFVNDFCDNGVTNWERLVHDGEA